MTPNPAESGQDYHLTNDQNMGAGKGCLHRSSLTTEQLQAQGGQLNPLPPIFGKQVSMLQSYQNSKQLNNSSAGKPALTTNSNMSKFNISNQNRSNFTKMLQKNKQIKIDSKRQWEIEKIGHKTEGHLDTLVKAAQVSQVDSNNTEGKMKLTVQHAYLKSGHPNEQSMVNGAASHDQSASKFVSTLMAKEQQAPGPVSDIGSSNRCWRKERSSVAHQLKDEFL